MVYDHAAMAKALLLVPAASQAHHMVTGSALPAGASGGSPAAIRIGTLALAQRPLACVLPLPNVSGKVANLRANGRIEPLRTLKAVMPERRHARRNNNRGLSCGTSAAVIA